MWLLICIAIASAWSITAWLKRYAFSHSLIDVPGKRSSHSVPTPRGGGLSIVVVFLVCLLLLVFSQVVTANVAVALLGAGGLVSLIGWLDDHSHIAARWRLLVHFLAATWAVAWLGGIPTLIVLGLELNLGWLGYFLMVLYLVWLLNLYNFMDGIDGIAGIEAITACLGGVLLFVFFVPNHAPLAWLPALMGASVLGFLLWNFPPAKIFMGDVGSGFLGIMLAAISMVAAHAAPQLLWSWAILLGVFIVDATVTLLRRLAKGQKVYVAHCSHAYQNAARLLGGHKPVILVIGMINLFWLLPLALLVGGGWLDGFLAMVIAYSPLVWLAFCYKAGISETYRSA